MNQDYYTYTLIQGLDPVKKVEDIIRDYSSN